MADITIQEAYEKWAGELVRFATVLVGPDDAADVVADAFVEVLRKSAWAEVDQPKAYLFGVVANRARMQHRTSGRRRRRDDVASRRVAVPETDPSNVVLSTNALVGLSEQQRMFVYLAYWMDWTAAQIAECVGVSDGTVRRQLARARARLRRELA